MSELMVRIVGERLPGRTVAQHTNVHIGVQKGDAAVDLVPGDARTATFDISIVRRDDDFKGPYVHGKRGDRFLYLVWVNVDEASRVEAKFSRIKLMLEAVPTGILRPETTRLEGFLSLTDEKGKIRVASIRPPVITWASS